MLNLTTMQFCYRDLSPLGKCFSLLNSKIQGLKFPKIQEPEPGVTTDAAASGINFLTLICSYAK